jgi:hypothetical protein
MRLCPPPCSWANGDLAPLHDGNVKSLVHNTIDHCIELTARGIVQCDALLTPLRSLVNIEAAVPASMLLHQRWPDPMHMLENISQRLYAHLDSSVDAKSMRDAHERVRAATGITKLTGLVPSYRWRLIWGSYPVTWAAALDAARYAPQRLMIECLSLVASILYAKPEHRGAITWLRLIGAAFQLHQQFVRCGVGIRLSEHLLWPHMPVVYSLMDGYNVLCEAHEYVWKVVRRVWPAINPVARAAVTQLMIRVCAQNYQRYLRVDKRDRQGSALWAQWWRGRPVQRMTLTGDVAALVAMLHRCGFVEGTAWHREFGAVVLHTATADPALHTPRPHSVAEAACSIADLHTSYIYRTPSIANAHTLAARAAAPVKTEPKPDSASAAAAGTATARSPLSADTTDDDETRVLTVEDDDSSDADY